MLDYENNYIAQEFFCQFYKLIEKTLLYLAKKGNQGFLRLSCPFLSYNFSTTLLQRLHKVACSASWPTVSV